MDRDARLIHQGPINDMRNTDNAWVEMSALSVHSTTGHLDNIILQPKRPIVEVQWVPIEQRTLFLPAHIELLLRTCEARQGHCPLSQTMRRRSHPVRLERCELERRGKSFGFAFSTSGERFSIELPSNPPAALTQRVCRVEPDSVAEDAKVAVGHRVLSINNVPVSGLAHEEVISHISGCDRLVALFVVPLSATPMVSNVSSPLASPPREGPAHRVHDILIERERDDESFGFCIASTR